MSQVVVTGKLQIPYLLLLKFHNETGQSHILQNMTSTFLFKYFITIVKAAEIVGRCNRLSFKVFLQGECDRVIDSIEGL